MEFYHCAINVALACSDELRGIYCFRVTFRVHSVWIIILFMTSKIFNTGEHKTEMDEHAISVDFVNVNRIIMINRTL